MSFLSSSLDVVIIILGFGLLIFVHEMGHFLAAKWAGIRTEAFAVGMGPVVASYRKGIGFALGSTDRKVVARAGKPAYECSGAELERHGIGETEYSLRWLPIGGFVKMLGQEDANPSAVSNDPRSYTQRPIHKRMVVVAAGVVMNLILAAVLFIIAFMAGVPFTAPVIGQVSPSLPAGRSEAINAGLLGVERPGLHPGDRVTSVDGKKVETFADLQIAAAMSRPGHALNIEVERAGLTEPLQFSMTPEKDPGTRLLSIGVAPASSNILYEDPEGLAKTLAETGLEAAGVEAGMAVIDADGRPISTFQQLEAVVAKSRGDSVPTTWSRLEEGHPVGAPVAADLPVRPVFQTLIYPAAEPPRIQNFEQGLLGLTPPTQIREVAPGPNESLLQAGDVILRLGHVDGPRMSDVMQEVPNHRRDTVDLQVLRDGAVIPVTAHVSRKGRLNVILGWAWDEPLIAEPMQVARRSLGEQDSGVPTAAADTALTGRMRFTAVNDTPVADWAELRAALVLHTMEAFETGSTASVDLVVEHATPGREIESVALQISPPDVTALHELGWQSELSAAVFRPMEDIRNAGGNPLVAAKMGVQETHKLILLTYLTIDRLFRRSVGVEQLQGPLGIVHLGSKIIDSGFMYLIFFLGMISVNLAVINFLPIPIVDGGLFLFLVYEKIKGRPPSIAFQNAATLVGLFLIGTVFLVVTWNDVMRIFG